jgi:hypothetical protein
MDRWTSSVSTNVVTTRNLITMKCCFTMAAALLVVSCVDQKAWLQKWVPRDDDTFARQFVEFVRTKRYEQAKAMLSTEIRGQANTELQKMQPVVDHGEAKSFETIGCFTNYFTPWGGKTMKKVALTYQLHFSDAWALVEVVVQSSTDGRYVAGAHFSSIPDSLEVLNRFTFENKTPIHYLFFAACVLIPIFILATIIICIRSRVRRRWLWTVFILFGLMQFQLNWTNGQISVHPIGFLVLGAAYFRAGLYAPLTLSFGIPLGGMIFLLLKSKLPRKDRPPRPNKGSDNAVAGN